MAKKKKPEEHENLERWMVSYSDFVTLLFATFVVLYALSQVDLSEYTKLEDGMKKAFNNPSLISGQVSIFDNQGTTILDNTSADSFVAPLMLEYVSQKYEEQAYKEIKEKIEQMTKNGDLEGVEAKITNEGLVITFKNDFVFFSGSAALTEKATKLLDNIGATISEKFALHYIRVEGHTDNQPINTYLYPSNWELSSARSSSIIRYLSSRFKFMPNIFSAVGYADTRPVADNSTEQGRAKNRRVEILILKNKYKNFEHPSNTAMKQDKKVQQKFQNDRKKAIEEIKKSSPALQKVDEQVKSKTEDEELKNIKNSSKINKETPSSTRPETSEDNSLSIQNKTLYEEASKLKNENEDDNWLNDAKMQKILQKDINKQFEIGRK
jgi:chemotaxis protein MotB